MNALVAVAIGVGICAGLLLVVEGLRGRQVLPSLRQFAPTGERPVVAIAWFAAAFVAGLVVFALTGWIVAAFAVAGLVWWTPRRSGVHAQRQLVVARTDAIAGWAEMIRDNMAGSAGLEQALLASSRVAPAPIAAELARFAARLDRMPIVDALIRLGEDLDHPSADLVVVSLVNASRMEARELGPLLGRLADAIRGDVKMRLRVEVGRARIRTSARIVIVTTLVTMAFLFLFSRRLLVAYDSFAGQLWLVLVAGVFAAGGWLLRVYGQIDMPERFSARAGSLGGIR
jgi:tight adherence protein B